MSAEIGTLHDGATRWPFPPAAESEKPLESDFISELGRREVATAMGKPLEKKALRGRSG